MKKSPNPIQRLGFFSLGTLLVVGGIASYAWNRDLPAGVSSRETPGRPTVGSTAGRMERSERDVADAVPRQRLESPSSAPKLDRESLEQEALERYAQNPTDAVAWACSLGAADEREIAQLILASELVRDQPREALELALDLSASSQRDDLLERAIREWSIREPHDAVAWAQQVTDVALRPRLLGGAILEWSQTEPQEAATMAVESLGVSGRVFDNLVVGIVQRWGQTDPEAATAWVSAFPDGALKEAAATSLSSILAVARVPGQGE